MPYSEYKMAQNRAGVQKNGHVPRCAEQPVKPGGDESLSRRKFVHLKMPDLAARTP